MWEGAARWSTQLRRGCWVATGLSWWMACSDPQGSGHGRESINPAKMKLCLGCHNPFASSKLYKLFAVFFAFGWWLIWYSWDPICRGVAFELDLFIWDHVHLIPRSFVTCSFETIFTCVFFIWVHLLLRSHSFNAKLKWSCFDLLWITFLWSTFHFFAGDLKFCKVTLHLKFCKVSPFRVLGRLTLFTHVLSTPGKYRPGSLWKVWWCCGCTMLTAVCYWPSNNCVPAQKIVSVLTELNHNRSALVLDSNNGVCCHNSST